MAALFTTKRDSSSTLWGCIPVLEFLVVFCFYAIITKPYGFPTTWMVHSKNIAVLEIALYVATIFAIIRRNTFVLRVQYWFSIFQLLYTHANTITQTVALTSAIASDYGFDEIETFYYGNSSEVSPGLFLGINLFRDNIYNEKDAAAINDIVGTSVGNVVYYVYMVDLIEYFVQIFLLNRAINIIRKEKIMDHVAENKEIVNNEKKILSVVCE